MKPYFVLFRAGPESLHSGAVTRLAAQNFDYALSYFGDDTPPAENALFVHRQKGPKWPGLQGTLRQHWDIIRRYEYVWLPDDDLLCEPELISKMFAISADLKLDLAQPALTHDSYFSHLITLQHKAFQVRFTNFVEIMAPIFATPFLERVIPTLAGSLSGWGLDVVWPRMSRLGKVAIVDDAPVKHTRPIGSANYAANRNAGVPAVVEAWLCSASSFVDAPLDHHINFAGVLQNGDPIVIGPSDAQIDRMLKSLIESLEGAPSNAVRLTRYLADHLSYWTGERYGRRSYPLDVLQAILNRDLGPIGVRFPGASPPAAAGAAVGV